MDLVSVIMPCYNSSSYINQSISSVISQTYTNWELVLVDDCSTDQTLNVIKELQANDYRIRLFENEFNRGAAYSRNEAIKHAKGRYLAFLDSDDWWLPQFLERSIDTSIAFQNPFVYSSCKRYNQVNQQYISNFIAPSKVTYHDVLKSNGITCSTVVLDVKVLGKKYMPEIKKRQDLGLWIQYLKEIPYAVSTQGVTAVYRMRQDSISNNKLDLIPHQWFFYRSVAKCSRIKSVYFLCFWVVKGYLKYRR